MRKAVIVALLAVVELALLAAIVASVGAWSRPGWSVRVPAATHKATVVTDLELDVVAGQTLEVINPIGRITITGGADRAIARVTVTGYGVTAAQAQRAAEEVRVEATATPSGRLIRAIFPRVVTVGPSDSAAMDISVPVGVALIVTADTGRITVRDQVGDARLNAAMGGVVVDGIEGNLDIDARMGSVNVSSARITDTLRIIAAMGSVEFAGVPGRTNRVSASMGSIAINLVPGVTLDVEVSTSMGSVSTELPFAGERSRTRLDGRIGTGEPTGVLVVTASMGSIGIR